MSRSTLLALALLCLQACREAPPAPADRAAPKAATPRAPVASAAPWPPQSVFHSETRWQSQRGADLTLAELAGYPLVVAMVFTSCRASCPVMMADLLRIERALDPTERAATRFVVVSFDARNDTPTTLRAFADEHRVDQERWTFLRGEEDAVRELAALLDVRYVPLPQGGFDHANVITVLDARGVIRHRQVGLNQPPEALLTQLRATEPLTSGAGEAP